MKISLLEPIGISAKAVEELAAKLVEAAKRNCMKEGRTVIS